MTDNDNVPKIEMHRFGLRAPEGTQGPVWGCRAIYSLEERTQTSKRKVPGKLIYKTITKKFHEARIDSVWDRQQMEGGTDEERKALATWLDKKGLVLLRKYCTEKFITNDTNEQICIQDQDFTLEGNCRESYGYIYLVAYKTFPTSKE